jgi:hypothetical protein
MLCSQAKTGKLRAEASDSWVLGATQTVIKTPMFSIIFICSSSQPRMR